MTLFGDLPSESPRLPSPWLSRSSGASPSPHYLSHSASSASSTSGGSSTPRTPVDRATSPDGFALLDGLAEDFEAIALSKRRRSSSERESVRHERMEEEIRFEEGVIEGLIPEVDHEGNCEYKLMLPTPTSQHRLEKLRTQLKWRLSEGGGQALYEIGVLDDGKIVGLTEEKMVESLRTLSRMLAGLGGGRIHVTRVLRIGGTASVEASSSPSTPTSLFPSFDVSPTTSDLDLRSPPSLRPSVSPTPPFDETAAQRLAFFPPVKVRGPVPLPSTRTVEEQIAFRRDKRDQRRARREAAGVFRSDAPFVPGSPSAPSPAPAAFPPSSSPISIPSLSRPSSASSHRPPRFHTAPLRPAPPRPPKPHKPPRADKVKVKQKPSPSSPAPNHPPPPLAVGSGYAPVMPSENAGEVRYVVEAVVHKGESSEEVRRKSRERLRRGSGASTEEGSTTGTEGSEGERSSNEVEGEEEKDEEGWDYLEFDLASLSSSVKSAAAAAAAAGMGGNGVEAAVVTVGA